MSLEHSPAREKKTTRAFDLDQLLTSQEVCETLRRSRASLYRDIAAGLIPAPVKIGHSSRWPASEIRALVEKAKAARGAEAD